MNNSATQSIILKIVRFYIREAKRLLSYSIIYCAHHAVIHGNLLSNYSLIVTFTYVLGKKIVKWLANMYVQSYIIQDQKMYS